MKTEADLLAIAKQTAIRADVSRIMQMYAFIALACVPTSLNDIIVFCSISTPLAVVQSLATTDPIAFQPLLTQVSLAIFPLINVTATRDIVRPFPRPLSRA